MPRETDTLPDIQVQWTESGIPSEESIIDAAAAGMVSRKDEPYESFVKDLSLSRAKEFLTKMIEYGHESVLEHITFQFWVSMSRVASHQQVRHRMASYTQMSLRKKRSLTTDDFVVPPQIKSEDLGEWIADSKQVIDTYEKWLAKGYEVDVARRKLTQEARTDMVMTINARSLRNYFNLRAKHDADFEINAVAKRMYQLICEEGLGFLFEDIGFE
ncbi:FAD-dependent thymidylate synthase [Candidatus Thorarchaeota archaeon]|nr:MAG: FAD-dependent thymidylate synthase [Candidatus Thorarchaeota archaeon]